ncbi:uncharacterized protein [Chelonus insularis]|uniref:uncharacterized protein n=1 Tax=Chelonus insularis TaxID=460826 RepID=UPI00158A1A0F|nr:uncharacterized protein LOC118066402 [Chelonus insularis]
MTLKVLLLLFVITAYNENCVANSADTNEIPSNNDQFSDNPESNKTLYVKVIPGYPGVRSDIYEVYMEPYDFAIGTKAMVDLKSYQNNGLPIAEGPRGILSLEQYHGGIKIKGHVSGLNSKMPYELIVYQKGQLSEGCLSAGKPYNPYSVNNETPVNGTEENIVVDPLYRISNLIDNIRVEDDGIAEIEEMTNHHYFTLTNRVNAGIIGRTIVMKEKLSQSAPQQHLLCGIIGFA